MAASALCSATWRLHPGARAGDSDLGNTLASYMQKVALPALELYTEGLLTDRSRLEACLAAGSKLPPTRA